MIRSPISRALWTLLALAVLLKAAVPFGYMPDTRALADGLMRIRICTGMGAQNIWVDKNLKPATPHEQPRYGGDCVFATGLHFAPEYGGGHFSDFTLTPLLVSFRAIAGLIPVIFNPAAPARAPPALLSA